MDGALGANGDAAESPRAASLATEGEDAQAGASAGVAPGANGAALGDAQNAVPAAAGGEAAPPPLSADGATPDPTPGCVNPCTLA